jgi:hypothetical protein
MEAVELSIALCDAMIVRQAETDVGWLKSFEGVVRCRRPALI